MGRTTRIDLFGIDRVHLMTVLKRVQTPIIVSSREEDTVPVLIKGGHFLLRTWGTDDLLTRFPLSQEPYDIRNIREGWQRFEETPATLLHLTNIIVETENGLLARKLVTLDGVQSVYLDKHYLDVFGTEREALRNFHFASVHQLDHEVRHSPVRISLKENHTCGYIMCMVNVSEDE